MHLNSNHHDEVHNRHCREAENEAIGFTMAIELLRNRKHLHSTINQRCHREQSCADHGYDQVTDIVLWKGQAATEKGEEAEEVRVLPLVGHGHRVMRHQAEVADYHLRRHQQPDEKVDQI